MADGDFQSEDEGEFLVEEELKKPLSKEEAAACLNCVGPTFRTVDDRITYSPCTYAYIAMHLVGRNLTDLNAITDFGHVTFLDISMNRLTDDSLNALAALEQLIVLTADNNRFETAVMPTFSQLQILSLKQNRITTCRVNLQPNLEYFELAGNNIRELRAGFWGPKKLPKLKELGLRDNGLLSPAGINFPNLVSLFLADNDITVLKGLEVLTNLKFLHLRNNPLESLDGFSKANRKLFYLNVRSCKIKNVKELKKLSDLPRLERIVVVDNPFTQTEYRIQVIARLPKLRRIDKTLVDKSEKRKAMKLAKVLDENDENDENEEEEGEDE